MRIIQPKESLLYDEVFKKSIVDYTIMINLAEYDDVLIYQSDKNLLAIQQIGSPMWIWVDPSISSLDRKALLRELAIKVSKNNISMVFGYEDIVKYFSEHLSSSKGTNYKINPGMNAYYCPTVLIKSFKHEMLKADTTFVNTVADIYARSNEGINKESANTIATSLIQNVCVYLLKADDKYVSMANISQISLGYARINSVYTPVKHRSKGYATDLMTQLSTKLIADYLVPVLYTDEANPISNRVYRKVGYVKTGRIISASFS